MHEMKKWLEEKETAMRKWLEKTEETVVAVSFAESGKHLPDKVMARIKLIHSGKDEDFLISVRRIFAEAGNPDLALELLSEDEVQMSGELLEIFLENVGLKGVRVKYLIATI
ncbi:hypothetical protein ACFL03_01640 [Thermodesulfobacteriota bacterium]